MCIKDNGYALCSIAQCCHSVVNMWNMRHTVYLHHRTCNTSLSMCAHTQTYTNLKIYTYRCIYTHTNHSHKNTNLITIELDTHEHSSATSFPLFTLHLLSWHSILSLLLHCQQFNHARLDRSCTLLSLLLQLLSMCSFRIVNLKYWKKFSIMAHYIPSWNLNIMPHSLLHTQTSHCTYTLIHVHLQVGGRRGSVKI